MFALGFCVGVVFWAAILWALDIFNAMLQEILDKNVAFKKESLRLLKQSEDEAQAPLKDKLNAVLAKIGQERGFAFILNIDGNAAPWINTSMGVNITDAVIEALNAQ